MGTLPQLVEEDIRELDRAMRDLLAKSESTLALLIDKGGFLVTHTGDYDQFDTTTFAALSAASFAATQSIASLVNESDFSSVYQQGQTYSLLVMNVDEYSLLTVLFKAQISVGAVKYYAATTIKQISRQLKKAYRRAPDSMIDLSMLNLAETEPLFKRKAG